MPFQTSKLIAMESTHGETEYARSIKRNIRVGGACIAGVAESSSAAAPKKDMEETQA